MGGEPTYRRWRAPRGDGDSLIDPPLGRTASLLADNRKAARRQYRGIELGDRTLGDLARQARYDLIEAAGRYTSAYRDVPASLHSAAQTSSDDHVPPVILSGHQPELFHPGVWFKNFVLASVGADCGAAPINLLVDNDVSSVAAIRVPTGSREEPWIESVPYDRPLAGVPYEQRPILDVECFATFSQRVERSVSPFVSRPLVATLWPSAVEAARRTKSLGRSLAEARHRLEGAWGLATLELPLGEVCRQPAWHVFAAHLLARHARLRNDYNAALFDYRRAARIRSRTHPVPQLVAEDDWRELPLWIWSDADPQRRRLWVRRHSEEIELTDRAGFRRRLDAAESTLATQLAESAEEGVKLRPRALITTMYARLVLGDLFLHGIGGSKYDELTDEIIRRFFGVEPTAYSTVTATRCLAPRPLEAEQQQLRRIDRALRDMHYNPDRFVDEADAREEKIAGWIAEKRRLIAAEPPPGARKGRHQAIEEANRRLRECVESKRRELVFERQRLAEQVRVSRLIGSREFSFCLFPEESLRPWLLELSHIIS
jgi:hypothetical protein